MNTATLYNVEASKNGSKKKIKTLKEYRGFDITNKKTYSGYKLQAYAFRTDVFINPIYVSFESIKAAIDRQLDKTN